MTRLPSRSLYFALALILLPFPAIATRALADDSAAQAIAGKFAAAAEAEAKKQAEKKAAEEEAKKRAEQAVAAEAKKRAEQSAEEDEIEMLTQARREAADRAAAAAAARDEDNEKAAAAHADDERKAEEARRIDEARQAEEDRKAEAARLAEQQRQAEEARLAQEARKIEDARRAEEARKADEDRFAEEARKAEAAHLAEAARFKRLEADREEEARRLTEKLNRVAAERERRAAETAAAREEATKARDEPQPAPPRSAELPQNNLPPPAVRRLDTPTGTADLPWRSAPPAGPPLAPVEARVPRPGTPFPAGSRVTVLLVLDSFRGPGRGAFRAAANPVLCIGESCWISGGTDRNAVEMPRVKALGPFNTIGARAGACNRKLACVFRDVDLDGGRAELQPVELGFMRHVRHQGLVADPDRSCDVAGKSVVCGSTLRGDGWRAWVIPEPLAASVGAGALKAALDQGLPSARAAALTAPVER